MGYIVETCVGNYELQRITKEVKHDVLSVLKDNVKELKLYGSYARGDFNNESDIDIFLLYDEKGVSTKDINNILCDISLEYQFKYGIMVNIYDMSIEYYNKYKNILPLIKNIEREGLII